MNGALPFLRFSNGDLRFNRHGAVISPGLTDLRLFRRERHFESMKKGRVVFSCDSFRFVTEEETMGFGMSRNFSGDHASESLWWGFLAGEQGPMRIRAPQEQ
jgi:hypothetical protein